jgi:hypothetical protein
VAVSTINLNIRPEDGWVLAATNPSRVVIKPSVMHPWRLAVSLGVPSGTLRGLAFGNDRTEARQAFELVLGAPIAGEVYIRIDTPTSSMPIDAKMEFGVFRDQ